MNYQRYQPVKQKKLKHKLLGIVIIALLLLLGGYIYHKDHSNSSLADNSSSKSANSKTTNTTQAVNYCAGNTDQNIIVSISKQHLWACNGPALAYDSPVVTGMQMYQADLTPTGTYHIYGKMTDQTLAGSDSTGSWSDYVYYWMPFLDNQYGTYGFHDLTQSANGADGRADSDFGKININLPYTAAKHGSHGCVELPLATAKWLYNWSIVGTTVTIQS